MTTTYNIYYNMYNISTEINHFHIYNCLKFKCLKTECLIFHNTNQLHIKYIKIENIDVTIQNTITNLKVMLDSDHSFNS